MKILKVKVVREVISGGGTHYVYPPEYEAEKIKVLCYESIGDRDGVAARGDKDEYLIGVVEDADVAQFTASKDIVEVTKSEAVVLGDVWKPRRNKLLNQQVVMEILSKHARGIVLTQEEKDMIDPDNPAEGLNKSPTFEERLTRLGL